MYSFGNISNFSKLIRNYLIDLNNVKIKNQMKTKVSNTRSEIFTIRLR